MDILDEKCFKQFGFCLLDTYKHVVNFYREQEGKTVHVSYSDKLFLVALMQQVAHGSLQHYAASSKFGPPALGALDVVGLDRRNAWSRLGDIDRNEAMFNLIHEVSSRFPLLELYMAAQLSVAEKAHLAPNSEMAQIKIDADMWPSIHEKAEYDKLNTVGLEEIDSLNAKSFDKFRAYAEVQFPLNPDQQAVLVRRLQDQDYEQYLLRKYTSETEVNGENQRPENVIKSFTHLNIGEDKVKTQKEELDAKIEMPTMCTNPNVLEFKSSSQIGVVQVDHGESITIRVPTLKVGNGLIWEFATDDYDIGFGLFFEWAFDSNVPLETEVSLHLSDSDEESEENSVEDFEGDDDTNDDDDDEDGGEYERDCDASGQNVEIGRITDPSSRMRPPISLIIPIYRRDCHLQVYTGFHVYPGRGVYLLKFDNTFSLWRSKTLYYRVYYASEPSSEIPSSGDQK